MSVPASSERFIAKARGLPVDEVMLDLEDSVAPDEKPAARELALAALRAGGWDGKLVAVRVNGATTPWAYRDVIAVAEGAGSAVNSLILPKVSDPAAVVWLDLLLGQIERSAGLEPGRIGIEAQIEDAAGLAAVEAIAASSSRLVSLVFGPADFMASIGMRSLTVGGQPEGYAFDAHHYPLMRMLVAAKARGLQAIDGPYARIHDTDGLRAAAGSAAALGYDGKWVLHPAQVDIVNAAFTPAPADYARAVRIVDAYEHATSVDRRGAVMLDGEMIDEASRKLALAIVAKGTAAGLLSPGGTTPGPPRLSLMSLFTDSDTRVAVTCMGRYRAIVVMRAVCPRCQRPAHAPTAWSSAWRCDLHGEIHPLAPARLPTMDGLRALVRQAHVPVWLPWPLPAGWLVSGFTGAGDERTGTLGSAVALSGPNPLGGPADMLIVAEEPGVGLGAGLAGLPGPDPGDGFATSQPNATVKVANHDAPLWLVESDGKAVFAGEVEAHWVWLVLWPDTAGTLLIEPLPLRDLRHPEHELDVPFGALTPRLPLSSGGTTPRTPRCAPDGKPSYRARVAPGTTTTRTPRGAPDGKPPYRARVTFESMARPTDMLAAVHIDLHVHSSASDGTDPPGAVIRRAAAAGLDVVALTDHDTQAGVAEACSALPTGLTLLPGMELSCQLDGRSVHLLGYLFDPVDPVLRAETSRIRDDRVYRAKAMTERLRELGADVSWEQVTAIAGDAVVGRPHLARALAASGAIADPAEAFTADWIGDGGRAFVDRYAPELTRAVGLVRAAGGVAVLAHPRSPGYEIPDAVIAKLAGAGLTGIEVFHPDHDDAERARLTGLARSLGLISTGGSDDHGTFIPSGQAAQSPAGHGLGTETTPPLEYERLLAAAGTRP